MSVCLPVSVPVYVHVHVHVPVQPGCSHTRAGSFHEGGGVEEAGGHTDELVQSCWRAANDTRKGEEGSIYIHPIFSISPYG